METVLDQPTRLSSNLTVEESAVLLPEILSLLRETIWGTDEALYTMTNVLECLNHLRQPRYFLLRRHGRLVGVRIGMEKEAWLLGQWRPVLYHSFFAMAASEKGRGYGKWLAQEMMRRLQNSASKRIWYAFVEEGNQRSRRLLESLGYQYIRPFQTLFFSRFTPKRSSFVRHLRRAEVPKLTTFLKERYANHSLLEMDPGLQASDYYVLEDHQGIIAGLQVHPQRWSIHHLGGISGKIAMKMIPHIAPVRRLFNPPDFRFLKWGHLYVRSGQEKVLLQLMEAVLALYNHHTGMAYIDPQSPVDQPLSATGNWGLMRPLLNTTVHVLAHFPSPFSETDITTIRQMPVVLSPNDA